MTPCIGYNVQSLSRKNISVVKIYQNCVIAYWQARVVFVSVMCETDGIIVYT